MTIKTFEREVAINQPRASYFVGGAEVVSLRHTRSLVELGHRANFYTLNPHSIGETYSGHFEELKTLEDERPDQLTIVELDQDPRALEMDIYSITPGEDKTRWYTEAMFYNRVLFEHLMNDEESTDVLFSYYQFDALAVPASRVRKNVLYLCGIPSTENNLRTSQLAMFDQLFAISDPVRDYWQQFEKRPIETITSGVAIPSKLPKKKESDSLSIVFAGRLIERKGCADLINAVASLPEDIRTKTQVTIFGTGPQQQALEQLADEQGLKPNITFAGVVDDLSEHFALSDMCVFPSRRGEGLMGVVLEAMAAGACVVSTHGNGNEPVFGNSRGILYEPGNIEALHGIIEELYRSPARRRKLGGAALKHVQEHYNWNSKTAELLEKII